VACAAAALGAAASQGCWGAEFSVGAAADSSPPDAAPDAPGPPEAGGTFCSTQTDHQFCDDFDTVDAPPSNFALVTTSNFGMLTIDSTLSKSAPNSLFASLSSAPPAGASGTALLSKPFVRTGSHFVFSADLRMRAGCFAGTSTVAPWGLLFGGYALALFAGAPSTLVPSGAELVEIPTGPDGGATGLPAGHALDAPLPVDQWFSLSINVQAGINRVVDVSVNNIKVLTGAKLGLEPTVPPQHPLLVVGASLNALNCWVHVDNVVFDVLL
jgi:hypothetical protein